MRAWRRELREGRRKKPRRHGSGTRKGEGIGCCAGLGIWVIEARTADWRRVFGGNRGWEWREQGMGNGEGDTAAAPTELEGLCAVQGLWFVMHKVCGA